MYKVAIITSEQAKELKNISFNKNCFFNPVLDLNNNFIISEEEIKAANIDWLNKLELIEYKPKIQNNIL